MRGQDGLPAVRFDRGACDFCAACADVCATGALGPARDAGGAMRRPWLASVGIGGKCISAAGVVCRVCAEACETGAIRFADPRGHGLPRVDISACTGCGACVATCPVQTVSVTVEPIGQEEVKS